MQVFCIGKPPFDVRHSSAGFTLVELVLVTALLAIISALVIPHFYHQIRREELPASGKQLRSLLSLMRAHAALDGKRYRLRFPGEDEDDALGEDRQPIIEREDDPIEHPEVFAVVHSPWAVGSTLVGEVWCAEVRLGKPTVEDLQTRRSLIEDQLERSKNRKEELIPELPPLLVEVDGTCEWATFVLTEAPRGTALEDLEDHPRLEVILDGATGLSWLQRPLSEEELDLFEEKGWPCVLGQDYLEAAEITEDRVLELREFRIQP